MYYILFDFSFHQNFLQGLKANAKLLLEEGNIVKPDINNEDSSNRKRSSSLTEQVSQLFSYIIHK